MSKVIELTEEQYAALKNGDSVTITPPKKVEQWEPRGGDWYIDYSGAVCSGLSSHSSIKFGAEYPTKEAATKAASAMRIHNRLLAYVDEFGGDWVPAFKGEGINAYVRYAHQQRKWMVGRSHTQEIPGVVYMKPTVAYELAAKLNSGEVLL